MTILWELKGFYSFIALLLLPVPHSGLPLVVLTGLPYPSHVGLFSRIPGVEEYGNPQCRLKEGGE